MSIETVTEKETRLSKMLTVCGAALKAVTAERDALQALQDELVYERDNATNTALESAAEWLDFYDGKGLRRAEAIRALKEVK